MRDPEFHTPKRSKQRHDQIHKTGCGFTKIVWINKKQVSKTLKRKNAFRKRNTNRDRDWKEVSIIKKFMKKQLNEK